jgi:hypothetical protein
MTHDECDGEESVALLIGAAQQLQFSLSCIATVRVCSSGKASAHSMQLDSNSRQLGCCFQVPNNSEPKALQYLVRLSCNWALWD